MKMINATAEGGQVTAEGVNVKCRILGRGQGKSRGLLLLDSDAAVYVCVPADNIERLADMIRTLAQIVASGVLASNAGGAITSPDFQVKLAELNKEAQKFKTELQ